MNIRTLTYIHTLLTKARDDAELINTITQNSLRLSRREDADKGYHEDSPETAEIYEAYKKTRQALDDAQRALGEFERHTWQ